MDKSPEYDAQVARLERVGFELDPVSQATDEKYASYRKTELINGVNLNFYANVKDGGHVDFSVGSFDSPGHPMVLNLPSIQRARDALDEVKEEFRGGLEEVLPGSEFSTSLPDKLRNVGITFASSYNVITPIDEFYLQVKAFIERKGLKQEEAPES